MKMTLRGCAACAALISVLALGACGTDPGDRAVSGGLIGAGAGAAVGAAVGNPGAGALIGGASDPCSLNLGDPWWRDHGGEAEYHRRCG